VAGGEHAWKDVGVPNKLRTSRPSPTRTSGKPQRVWFAPTKAAVEIGVVAFEASPVSTGLQIATLVGVHAATGDTALAVAAFAVLTLTLEVASVVAVTDLLDTDRAQRYVRKTHTAAVRLGLARLNAYRSNVVTDLGTTLLLGTPAALLVKHRQEPERTAAENRRYGCKLALTATVIWSAAAGVALAAATRPDLKELGLAVLGLGVVFSVSGWIRRRWCRRSFETPASPELIALDDPTVD
jgi:hypothetical protein